MIMPSLYVITRWQSKFKTMWTLLQNLDIVRAMCRSLDEDCRSIHDQDLSDRQWAVMKVSSSSFLSHAASLIFAFSLRNVRPYLNRSLLSRSSWKGKTTYLFQVTFQLCEKSKTLCNRKLVILLKSRRFEQPCIMIIFHQE